MSMTENKTINNEDNKLEREHLEKYIVYANAVDEMICGMRTMLECNVIDDIKPILALADRLKTNFALHIDEISARIYANANNENNYINDTFIQYLEDDVLLIIDKEDENYFVNLIYNDIECEPSCINNFSPDNRLKANEMISAIRNRLYDYKELRGNDYQPDFYKTDAFRVETEVNGLNTPSVDFDEKDDR